MATPYNHKAIEQKWRKHWQEHPVNVNDGKKPKYYCLDMFPYPSGSGLHVGHWRGYVISDVWSRYKLLQGYYIIHPIRNCRSEDSACRELQNALPDRKEIRMTSRQQGRIRKIFFRCLRIK